ncbi:MAG: DHH family phosphoesterase [Deltaproteobacteria bacterium]|jgi:nanoRNase/pAp phosphatase (c-di-AMP/oligoRNAs hydrolase)|nr:DHH family phosphoesterase [Deltaproteobacteria bacterium]
MSETTKTAAPKAGSRTGGAGVLKHGLFKPFVHEDKVLIVINADPDSIASSVALKRLLWRKVASVTIASVNEVRRPDNLRLMSAMKLNLPNLSDLDLSHFTKLAMVDSQPHHSPLTASLKFALVVDHHPLPTSHAYAVPDVSDIRPDFGATATIFVNYLKAARIKPNGLLATALFYAIKTDTQNFVRQGQIEDMKAFRYLYPMVHVPMLSNIEQAPISKQSFKVIHAALNQICFGKSFAAVHFEALDFPDTLVLAADFLMQIDGVNRAVTSGVFDGKLIVVMRSAGIRSSNLGRLAQTAFGQYGSAGGHKNMARAEMEIEKVDPKHALKPQQLQNFVRRRLREALAKKKTGGGHSNEELK